MGGVLTPSLHGEPSPDGVPPLYDRVLQPDPPTSTSLRLTEAAYVFALEEISLVCAVVSTLGMLFGNTREHRHHRSYQLSSLVPPQRDISPSLCRYG